MTYGFFKSARMMAIVERDMRKFLRSPALMLAAMVFPLVQLIVLGNAFGGKIHDARLGLVDHDGGPQAVRVLESLRSVESNARTFETIVYTDERLMIEDVRRGHLTAGLVVPPQFSRAVYEHSRPRIGLVIDNTDNFLTSSFEQVLTEMVQTLNQPDFQPRVVQQAELKVVELYPYIEYMKYLLPGSITLAMFVSVMIGGGIVYIDDKARGVHEGYLVTPITKMELVAGLNVAGALKAMGAGVVLTVIGSLLAGVGETFRPANLLLMLLMIVLTSFAFVTMMFFIMVRVNDPLVPRAVFGILNTLLYFPSGAIYPVQAFPKWLQWIAWVDPFTYSVHGFKAVLLKGVGLAAIWPDVAYLCLFALTMFIFSTLLFKRTL
ncbi:MAG TPA: ABC transporter permease [Candidatus Saccharimonadales bacterium]|jgi:ABC-2 type transport system permease protein|nr:ABC transporter permease [Candidatus Saccharimonadales bacterium]